jgi:hypothetical protein
LLLATQSEKRLEGGHRCSPAIEPKNELVQVGLKMGAADAVMGATKPSLEVPKDTMDARQNLGRPSTVALRVRSVPVPML